ncbi:hypothetical protein BGX21_009393 [Mortierella sp. AD011]|nr:hypothetical protein BGX21_009393 [Mortierella sp. AD011]
MEKKEDVGSYDFEANQPYENAEFNLANQHDQLARGLKSRHIQFLALGGAIGTGLFVGSGSILSSTGPASLFLAYLSMTVIVWNVMNNLAEMVVYLPMRGITVPYFVGRFLDPSLAFAVGWNYWYAYAMLIGAEATAAGIVIDYWNLPVNIAVWVAIVLVVMLILNIIAVSFFGEAEFWFASIKLITICGLIILGIVIFFGGAPNQDGVLGFHYWKTSGAFAEYKADENLLGASNASASPFVIGIQRVGIPVLNHIINAAILTSAWSAGNSFLYSGSRVLYSMSLSGQAPKCFSITNRRGVPYVAVLFTWCFGALAFLNVSNAGATVFNWFVSISTISGFIAWIVVMITYLRFRRAMEFNNLLSSLPYKTPLQPYATYFALLIVSLLTITSGFQTFMPFKAKDFIASYITIPVFLLFYFCHKVYHRTPMYIPVDQIDAITGKKEMDELEAMGEERVPKNWVQKVWYWLA